MFLTYYNKENWDIYTTLDLRLGKANLDIKTFSVMSLVSDLMIEVRSDFSSKENGVCEYYRFQISWDAMLTF